MITTSDGEEVVSDEEALAFMFAVYASIDGEEGMFSVPQPHRHRLIDKACHQVVTQFEVELAIPWVQGKFYGPGATVIYPDKPDFSEHVKLYDPNSFGVLDVQVEKSQGDGSMVYTGFGAYVRLGESNTWLSVGIKSPSSKSKSLLDFEDDEQRRDSEGEDDDASDHDDDEIYFRDDNFLDSPDFYDKNNDVVSDIAAQVAVANGFGTVALRPEPRRLFALKIVKSRVDDFVERDPFISERHIAHVVADRARDYWEFYVIPMRAKPLHEEGKSPAQIAKTLGITKNRAERAIELSQTLGDGLSADYIIPLILKNDPKMKAPEHG